MEKLLFDIPKTKKALGGISGTWPKRQVLGAGVTGSGSAYSGKWRGDGGRHGTGPAPRPASRAVPGERDRSLAGGATSARRNSRQVRAMGRGRALLPAQGIRTRPASREEGRRRGGTVLRNGASL